MQNPSPNLIRPAIYVTAITATILSFCSILVGRIPFFLFLNGDGGRFADFIFTYWTWLGDGVVWVGAFLWFLLFRRKFLPLFFSALLISTLLVQVTKYYGTSPRPYTAIVDKNPIHTVIGVTLHGNYSFPSGHTASAFTIFLLAALLIPNRLVVPIGFIYAAGVGYSRVYLAQHFPLDVAGGMFTAVLAIILSIFIQERLLQAQTNRATG